MTDSDKQDSQIQEVNPQNQEIEPISSTPRFNWKNFLFFIITMGVIYLAGTLLTPLFVTDELVVMAVYAAVSFFLGVNPAKWIKFKRNQ